jgi:hypothetical protein
MNGATVSRDAKRDAKRGGNVVRRYEERFLRMPVAFVRAIMWVTGAILMGSCWRPGTSPDTGAEGGQRL